MHEPDVCVQESGGLLMRGRKDEVEVSGVRSVEGGRGRQEWGERKVPGVRACLRDRWEGEGVRGNAGGRAEDLKQVRIEPSRHRLDSSPNAPAL
jgi:hypothetical protein